MNRMPIHVPQATRKGYIEVYPGGVFDFAYPDSVYRRGRVQGGGYLPGIDEQWLGGLFV